MCGALDPPRSSSRGKMAIVSEAPPGTETKPMSDWLTAYNGKWIPATQRVFAVSFAPDGPPEPFLEDDPERIPRSMARGAPPTGFY